MSYRDLVVLSATRESDVDPVLKPFLDIILLFKEESANLCGGPKEDR